MLTGDNRRTADTIAGNLGLEACAQLLPDAKLAASASAGVAMGGGIDVALETAGDALFRTASPASPI